MWYDKSTQSLLLFLLFLYYHYHQNFHFCYNCYHYLFSIIYIHVFANVNTFFFHFVTFLIILQLQYHFWTYNLSLYNSRISFVFQERVYVLVCELETFFACLYFRVIFSNLYLHTTRKDWEKVNREPYTIKMDCD